MKNLKNGRPIAQNFAGFRLGLQEAANVRIFGKFKQVAQLVRVVPILDQLKASIPEGNHQSLVDLVCFAVEHASVVLNFLYFFYKF